MIFVNIKGLFLCIHIYFKERIHPFIIGKHRLWTLPADAVLKFKFLSVAIIARQDLASSMVTVMAEVWARLRNKQKFRGENYLRGGGLYLLMPFLNYLRYLLEQGIASLCSPGILTLVLLLLSSSVSPRHFQATDHLMKNNMMSACNDFLRKRVMLFSNTKRQSHFLLR